MNDKPHLDEEALAELKDVMEDEFDVLIQTYLADSRSRIESLEQALSENNPDVFAKTAHSFKGRSTGTGSGRTGADLHGVPGGAAAPRELRLIVFAFVDLAAPGFFLARQDQVQDNRHHGTQGDPFQLPQHHVANTEHQGNTDDHQVT